MEKVNSSSIELNYYHKARKILSSSQKINDMLLLSPQKCSRLAGLSAFRWLTLRTQRQSLE